MKNLLPKLLLIAVVLALVLGACSGGGPGQGTPTPGVALPVKATGTNVAEAAVVPIQQVTLSFSMPGTIEDVLVAEGEMIKAGDVIARLKGGEKQQAAVTGAELELLNAQKSLDDLKKNAAVAAAQAEVALAKAKNDLDNAQKKQVSIKYDRATKDNLESARAQYTLAQKNVDAAQKVYDKLLDRPEKDPIRAQATVNLQGAKKARDQAKATLDWLLGFPSDLQVEEREANLSLAEAQVQKAQDDYDILKNGPDPKDLALAEARVRNAEAQLKSAQATLSDLELTAPMDGMVVTNDFKKGAYVNPGQNTVTLADISSWKIETTDLTELKVVNIKPDDAVEITFDAIPDLTLTGKVQRIKSIGVNKQGDITYTVIVLLDNQDERLRWNMTAIVTFNSD